MHSAKSEFSPNYGTRNLEGLHADHEAFMATCNGDKKQAARYHNCLNKQQLDVLLNTVAHPYLHLYFQGLCLNTTNSQNLLSSQQTKKALQPDERLRELGRDFKKYGSNWRIKYEIEKQVLFLQCCVVFSEEEREIRKCTPQHDDLQCRLATIGHDKPTIKTGPVASSLDPILTSNTVTPKAYHSRSFIGNHFHKYISLEL